MNKQEAHEILDNYKSSSLKQINEALIRTGDLDILRDTTKAHRSLHQHGYDRWMDRPCEIESQGVRGMSLWTVVRHWKTNQTTNTREEG